MPNTNKVYRREESLVEAARLKARQLEAEIRASSATATEKSNMLHTFSKLMMFSGDAYFEVKR